MTVKEAEQLTYLIFCTVSWLPDDLKNERWDRSKISSELAALSEQGLVRDITSAHQKPEHWNAIIDSFIFRKIIVDRGFQTRLRAR